MEKLEVLEQFLKLYSKQINPELISLKYCQTKDKSLVELNFKNGSQDIIDLCFIVGDIEEEKDGSIIENLYFDPGADLVDNAKTFVNMDSYSLINCIDGLFLDESAQLISDNYVREQKILK